MIIINIRIMQLRRINDLSKAASFNRLRYIRVMTVCIVAHVSIVFSNVLIVENGMLVSVVKIV
ncbi:hypothetical protein ACFL96_09825 [Thermoproteota archaeon]